MEQQQLPKKIQKYILAYRLLLDALDEYQDDIQKAKRETCDPQVRQDIYNRITQRCRKEGKTVFALLPRQEHRYRGLRLAGHSFRALSWLCLIGVGVCLARIVWFDPVLWTLMALMALTLNRVFDKMVAIVQDRLVWTILRDEYQPKKTVWSEEQKHLLPSRLLPYVLPLSSSVDPDNCIRSKVKCLCGCEQFRVWRHPQKGYFRATCGGCGKEIVLFDEHLDAYQADGKAQQYFPNALEMAVCRSCGSELHQVIVTVVSDEKRTFFQTDMPESDPESGYCMAFQMFCAECGMPSGDGTYFWCAEWENEEQRNREEEDR